MKSNVLIVERPGEMATIAFLSERITVTASMQKNGSVRVVVEGPTEEDAPSWPRHEFETPAEKSSDTTWGKK